MINTKEVLLLDDNDDTNYYNKDILEETKLFESIIVYTNPHHALDLIQDRLNQNESLPGIFLVDIKMPEMDGFEFLDELDEMIEPLGVAPKVLILSTSNHKRDKEQFERSFLAKEYINKPLITDHLIKILRP